MHGARYGRSRQCQHIHGLPEFLDRFLMCHTETLFLIHDEQSQILEAHIFGQHTMRTYDYIDHSVF